MSLTWEYHRTFAEISTFAIGGPIARFAKIVSIEQMQEAIALAEQEGVPFLVVGKGSNSVFPDRGFPGMVLLNQIDHCEWQEEGVLVGAGYSFSLLGVQSARRALGGLEFAAGIPASVGGAIFMNAGAGGQETGPLVERVRFVNTRGQIEVYTKEELSFSYRTSPFQQKTGAIVEVIFRLTPTTGARGEQLQRIQYRQKTQPYKDKSAGCVFRNPKGGKSAGALIEESGLKGTCVGGAMVSPLHANFIVNRGGATQKDVLELIEKIQKKIYHDTGIELETEVRVFR